MFQLDKIHNNPSATQLNQGFKINPQQSGDSPDLVSQKLRQPDPYANGPRRNEYAGNYGQPNYAAQGYAQNEYQKKSNGFVRENNLGYGREGPVGAGNERQARPDWQNGYDRASGPNHQLEA